MNTYYGYAFESYCTKAHPEEPPLPLGWSGNVNTNVQWCSVVKSKLRDMRIIIGGEVDCVRGKIRLKGVQGSWLICADRVLDLYTGEPDTFVELKTSNAIRTGYKNDKKTFEKYGDTSHNKIANKANE